MEQTEMQTSMTEAPAAAAEAATTAEAQPWWERLGEEQTEAAEPAPQEKPAEGLKVKYNGEETVLAGDDLVNAAQKGLNYDKVKGKLDSYESEGAKEALELEKMQADSMGMTIPQYRKHMRDSLQENALKNELKAIFEDSPDISDELANELAQKRLSEKQTAQREKREAEEAKPWEALAAAYPEIKDAADVPQDVRDAIVGGKDPLLAMREHEIAELKAQLEKAKADGEAAKQNAANKERSVGAVTANTGEAHDDVLEALMHGFR